MHSRSTVSSAEPAQPQGRDTLRRGPECDPGDRVSYAHNGVPYAPVVFGSDAGDP
ncbi:hypothetical protein ABZ319_35880 [Nocardia sp. NPDC005978]|uniref:hypothetical protein n=1 Tax=Nocardia sp. NPDC005978 TaxID=3156725 RepID=UPI0033BD15EC